MTTEPEILFDIQHGLGVITLNRPKALNALTLDMIREMERVLPAWEDDPAVKAVVLRGAGERAFCAGGDVAGLYREMRDEPDGTLRRDFFREEYIVNRRIYRYRKPWISLIDGIDMGGGVGLSVHGSHSIATEKFLFAMPETAIGLFPDVGGGYFLCRLRGALGAFLALTGHRLKVADALWAGIVQAHVPSARLADLVAALGAADLSGENARRKVDAVVATFAADPGTPTLPAIIADIDRCFSAATLQEVITKLRAHNSDWAHKQIDVLSKMSPTAMKITLEQLRRCANRSFEDSMTIEYRMAQACMRPGEDFYEGVRAVLIDKDQSPKWNPPTIDGVTAQMVEAHFEPVANDLVFD
ncbi:enoyl-CoA hydratase/isomerase family protein [Vineibacter terrae]|uniref:enoyl-CoA hydratase/isomerase family protein n=1 Tax=Vineibacter terrae TaxID=2586908 RepID=UPI002E344018|nr:enoyl-CoA hydratase/isomerase family protein [Vineibacter terrae]HEX2892349.1 enoyl-CoA hydratase/isomerase family protein [Vineibacter terrae]